MSERIHKQIIARKQLLCYLYFLEQIAQVLKMKCMCYQVLVDSDGDPSSSLRAVLAPEIRVKRVVFQGIGQCEEMNRPEVPKVFTEEPKVNFPPVPRNQVDHVNATVGQLLVFKVPEVCVLSIPIFFFLIPTM